MVEPPALPSAISSSGRATVASATLSTPTKPPAPMVPALSLRTEIPAVP